MHVMSKVSASLLLQEARASLDSPEGALEQHDLPQILALLQSKNGPEVKV